MLLPMLLLPMLLLPMQQLFPGLPLKVPLRAILLLLLAWLPALVPVQDWVHLRPLFALPLAPTRRALTTTPWAATHPMACRPR
jgi:hypothetical protein